MFIRTIQSLHASRIRRLRMLQHRGCSNGAQDHRKTSELEERLKPAERHKQADEEAPRSSNDVCLKSRICQAVFTLE